MAANRESGGMTPQMMRASGLNPMEWNGYDEGEVEEDVMEQKLAEIQEQSLGPLKEDLAEWLGKHLEIDISKSGMEVNADNFMDVLDNGVYLCQMAKIIQRKAHECVLDGSYTEPLPNYKLRCKSNAPSGSWFARDNTANFLSWCKAFGMADDQMFETEYLVSHTAEKSVVLCLLELARIGYKFGLEPPSLIKMEKEMERMEEEELPPPRPPPPKPNSLDDETGTETEEEEEIEEKTPPTPQSWSLDEEVKRIAFMCKCHDHVKKLGEGKYLIFGKVVQIRFLKNRHLMVRVGGGWDTLEHYLIHHNPVQVFEHRRPNTANGSHDSTSKYLCFKSKYKSE
ncbi:growth arrest-specific protein 2-like isoform X1 [Ylistrum balloti]|uniref:growth arrest-specific protein 2-like isoform X1 n=1 Tax=Ylistrum balloti TaxID=509963 RepID=UPI002905BF6A|nr:growth arrest-specific protein 2-like isoform X1 [Ylistrum balloti]XP_060080013.1 growth arrest-specific protein 2-like isoform X1 [Ylistrum balloti]